MRERLKTEPIVNLTDVELLMLLIGHGNKQYNLVDIAYRLLEYLDTNLVKTAIPNISGVAGIGEAKSCKIQAALEFSRRRYRPFYETIKNPEEAYMAIKHLFRNDKEMFICLTLNGAHEIINTHIISIGILNRTLIHPREFFNPTIQDKAAAVIATHNHPSGNLKPSKEDMEVTKRLNESGELLGIPLLDHIIFSDTDFYSIKENT
ncbi:RadC family protein [Spirochaeta cellobiosiphila]|uniref:RadC family protein n=1 Tax=Spirochaeta cellobiosiphila TaxID=504483 RepID=UPI00040AD961|nr:DNA repair protein RadC [Spirochaeta cellobiosiphila]